MKNTDSLDPFLLPFNFLITCQMHHMPFRMPLVFRMLHMLFHMLPVSLPACQMHHTRFRMLPVFRMLRMRFHMLHLSVCSRLCSILQCLIMPFLYPPVLCFCGLLPLDTLRISSMRAQKKYALFYYIVTLW